MNALRNLILIPARVAFVFALLGGAAYAEPQATAPSAPQTSAAADEARAASVTRMNEYARQLRQNPNITHVRAA